MVAEGVPHLGAAEEQIQERQVELVAEQLERQPCIVDNIERTPGNRHRLRRDLVHSRSIERTEQHNRPQLQDCQHLVGLR